jgi:hypothetical protein
MTNDTKSKFEAILVAQLAKANNSQLKTKQPIKQTATAPQPEIKPEPIPQPQKSIAVFMPDEISKPNIVPPTQQPELSSITIDDILRDTASRRFEFVQYSQKSFALFGDTKPIKDDLKAMGGKFNPCLTWNGERKAGWIFFKNGTIEAKIKDLIS